jgi:RND family efflux transporter MFP subunit
MRFLRRSLTGLVLLAATLAILALAAQTFWDAMQARMADEAPRRPAREQVFAVNTITVTPETIAPVLTTFGEILARRTLEVRARSSGTVLELGAGVEEGGSVTAGQLLFRIDPTQAETALAVAEADRSDAAAELRDAERALDLAGDELESARAQAELRARALQRQRDLAERGVATAAAIEEAELAAAAAEQAVLSRRQSLAQAEARLDQARSNLSRTDIALDEARRALDDTEIHAEFSGVLTEVAVVEGGLVTQNEHLASLIDPAALEVSFRVSTPQYSRLVDAEGNLIGLPLQVSLDIGGLPIATGGRISRESAAVGEGQTGRLLFARLDSPKGFRAGDFATVRVDEPPLERVVRLPAAAVDAAGTVLVLGDEARLEVAPVEILRRQGDDVLVRAGDLAGRQVVAERSPFLGAGIRVRPLAPAGEGEGGGEAVAEPAAPEMVELSAERRAALVAFVEANARMPDEAKARVLAQLREPQVPAQMIERLESRMGG